MQTTEPNPELVGSIKSAISMSGGLFQRHPKHPEWKTTRPGARPGEVAAFVRNVKGDRKSYISVCFHREGEGYDGADEEWDTDAYEIIISRGDGSQDRGVATDPEHAATIVAKEMEHISGD